MPSSVSRGEFAYDRGQQLVAAHRDRDRGAKMIPGVDIAGLQQARDPSRWAT